ncbi:MAG: class I SAM-dependent methyltransferase [Candidatus Binatia bacterium]
MLTLDYDRLGVEPGDRVLDIGCGGGRHSFEVLRRGGHAVALDLSDTDLKDVRAMFLAIHDEGQAPSEATAGAVCADALELPFGDATFDRVIASEVLEHIDDDLLAMAEIARVVRPGGTVAVTVPRTGQEVVCWALSREYHDTPGGHVRIYRRRQIVGRLASVGLQPYGIGFAHALHTPYWWLRCLVGPRNDDNRLVRAYRGFLEWDIRTGQPVVRATERMLDPVLGKSLVVYLSKPETDDAG